MKYWKLTYELQTKFSSPVTSHFYSLRCFPKSSSLQSVNSCTLDISPSCTQRQGEDSFGNRMMTGECKCSHQHFTVTVRADVVKGTGTEAEVKDYWQLGMYRHAARYTKMGDALQAFYQGLPVSLEKNPWKRTRELMEALSLSFTYVMGSTSFDTSAEEAYAQGQGVCQDYAHILLALCRKEDMTARYVAGAIPGEGETHAWIEVYHHGLWKGFDPTHNCETNEDYISFAVGRDASDCPLSQGIFLGKAKQTQQIYVKMEEQRL